MLKPQKLNFGETNIAGLGTPLEKKIREEAAKTEQAWKGAGDKVGVEIWRIEQFRIVPWPKDHYGWFYSDDSYIILHTYNPDPKNPSKLAYNVHFWIGESSSQDEYGTAAYKTVELDDFLGGEPVQYREVQHHESDAFRKLFPMLSYMTGGAKSGFRNVKPVEYRPRLLWIKGQVRVLVREVPITYESLNDGDSFLFDNGLSLLIWHGRGTNTMEKHKALMVAIGISEQRGGKCKREVFEQGICNETEWWKAIGGKGHVKPASEVEPDSKTPHDIKRLFEISDSTGRLTMNEIASGVNIDRRWIRSDDVYILDNGYEVIVWVGLDASPLERAEGMNKAVKYLIQAKRPLTTPISRVLEGGENEEFENFFIEAAAKSKADDPTSKESARERHLQHTPLQELSTVSRQAPDLLSDEAFDRATDLGAWVETKKKDRPLSQWVGRQVIVEGQAPPVLAPVGAGSGAGVGGGGRSVTTSPLKAGRPSNS